MKLLYLSCHAILEYDELKLFEELGINYFALGSYIQPQNPVDPIRPALGRIPDPDVLAMAPPRDKLTPEFIDRFDVIVIMHAEVAEGNWIEMNWETIKHKRVILRTIGQNNANIERKMAKYRAEGLQIVRYSPKEQVLEDYCGHDAIIRFYKDPEEFCEYNGFTREVVTFAQNMAARGEYCHFDIFKEATKEIPSRVFGPKNEEAGDLNGGFLSYQDLKQKMRDSRIYFYTGTQPASYTLNFIEAWMTGIPIVAIGQGLGNSLHIGGDLYEIQDFIQHGVNGIISDDISILKSSIDTLLNEPQIARSIGMAGRQSAIEIFGKEKIKQQWKEFLGV